LPVHLTAAKSYRASRASSLSTRKAGSTWLYAWNASSVWDKAAEAFHNASTLEPANADAHLGLAVLLHAAGRPQSALRGFERCLELAPDHEDRFLERAPRCIPGRGDEASKIYTSLLGSHPESEEPLST